MKLLNVILLGLLATSLPVPAVAAEAWVEVAVTATGDRTLVDQNSIQRTETDLRYWEYRDMRQSNSRRTEGNQPVYGMMIYRSVTCDSGESRMQRLVLFNQNRQVIRRVNYEESGGRLQPKASGAEAAIRYACGYSPS
ncbi:MAG: hypothetical protein KME07_24245 [Pegethrix bostrychoides GSE-TBD4-15B]|jgi:hypothetical protein|uniref:Surface-adhesin protein E-like domain-containing protein n=1 Tax=Pegethrix bostrychoides GSE-TBD4-15B TaxID=2839662 RepID=A0A951PH72_9CYAN|nr:hypothetical protein [Pegethrix bostrychoides GSE-TBD4-15B]